MVHKIFVSFKETKTLSQRANSVHTGNPIRKTTPLPESNNQALSFVSRDKFNLLITGGSQGASSINTAVSDAVGLLKDIDLYAIIHQTGRADHEKVSAALPGHGGWMSRSGLFSMTCRNCKKKPT